MSGRSGLSGHPPRVGQQEGWLNALEACALAADLVKRAGFVLRHASTKTEACYYGWPDRHGVLRIATHSKGARNPNLKNGPAIVSATFPEANLRGFTHQHVENRTCAAIGMYLMRANHTKAAG